MLYVLQRLAQAIPLLLGLLVLNFVLIHAAPGDPIYLLAGQSGDAAYYEQMRAQFGLANWEEELLRDDPGFAAPSPTARMDTFFTSEGLWFTEYNAETPAAPAYCDALTEVFLGLPIMQRFEREHDIWPLPGRHHVLAALIDAYRQWGGREQIGWRLGREGGG